MACYHSFVPKRLARSHRVNGGSPWPASLFWAALGFENTPGISCPFVLYFGWLKYLANRSQMFAVLRTAASSTASSRDEEAAKLEEALSKSLGTYYQSGPPHHVLLPCVMRDSSGR